jgi:hypothetical protein
MGYTYRLAVDLTAAGTEALIWATGAWWYTALPDSEGAWYDSASFGDGTTLSAEGDSTTQAFTAAAAYGSGQIVQGTTAP